MMTANVVDDTMSTLTDRSTYMGVAGVIVANVTGIALTMIPFTRLAEFSVMDFVF